MCGTIGSLNTRMGVDGQNGRRAAFSKDAELLLGPMPKFLLESKPRIVFDDSTPVITHFDHQQSGPTVGECWPSGTSGKTLVRRPRA